MGIDLGALGFVPRTILFYILPNAYIALSFFRLFGLKKLSFLCLPFFCAMALFPYIYHLFQLEILQDLFGYIGRLWLAFAYFVLIAFILRDIFSLGNRFFPNKLFSSKSFIIILTIMALPYSYSIYEAHTLQIRKLTIETDKLASPMRIVFLSDMHIGPQTGNKMLANTVDSVLEQNPDLILIGGDIFDDAFQGTDEDIKQLNRLSAPLGTYAVAGNHDAFGGFERTKTTLSKTGIILLSDETVKTASINMIGLSDPDISGQMVEKDLLKGYEANNFTILIDHRPRQHDFDYDLQLSGHTHGGQIVLIRPFLNHPPANEKIIITTGVGFSKLPLRFFAAPEIVVINVR